MRNISFHYMSTHDCDIILSQLFGILYSNMNVIASTNNSYEDDLRNWMSCIVPTLQNDLRKTVLIYCDSELIGFFRYYLYNNFRSLLMEEIQIKSEYQGMGIFSRFCRWLVNELPHNVLVVEAFVNKHNYNSIAVLEHLGLRCVGENKNGISFHYQGDYSFLVDKYC